MQGTHRFLLVLGILVLGGSLGGILFVWAQPARPTPPAWPPIGSTGHIRGDNGPQRLFVDESSLRLWERADTERNLAQLMVAEEQARLVFPPSTTVRVLVVDGTAVQVEILDGPLAGKRGWGLASHVAPDL